MNDTAASFAIMDSLMDAIECNDIWNQIQQSDPMIQQAEQARYAAEKEAAAILPRDLINWAGLYDNCTFEAKKMIAAQFIKAVHIKRDYEIEIEFNVAFSEFQKIYLEPEPEESKRKRSATTILALAETAGQAV